MEIYIVARNTKKIQKKHKIIQEIFLYIKQNEQDFVQFEIHKMEISFVIRSHVYYILTYICTSINIIYIC